MESLSTTKYNDYQLKDTLIKPGAAKKASKIIVGNYDGYFSGPLVSLSYGPLGKYIAAVSVEGSIKILDTTNKVLHTSIDLSSDTQPTCICFSPCGNYIATALFPAKLIIYDLQNMKEHFTMSFKSSGNTQNALISSHVQTGALYSMKYSAEGKYLILGFAERTLKFLDLRINQVVFNSNGLHQGGVYAIEYAPGGTQIATGSDDGSLRIIEFGANTLAKLLAGINPGTIRALKYSHNGNLIACGCSEGTLNIIDTQTWNITTFPNYHQGSINALDFSSENSYLVTVSAKNELKILDLFENIIIYSCDSFHKSSITGLEFSPDGRFFATCSSDSSMKLVDFRSRSIVHSFQNIHEDKLIELIVVSPEGNIVATAAQDCKINLIDTCTHKLIHCFGELKPGIEICSLQVSNCGTILLASLKDASIYLFDVEKRKLLKSLPSIPIDKPFMKDSYVKNASYSMCLRYCAFIHSNNFLSVRNMETGQFTLLRKIQKEGEFKISFTPTSHQLVVIMDEETLLLDLNTLKLIRSFEFGASSSMIHLPKHNILSFQDDFNTCFKIEVKTGALGELLTTTDKINVYAMCEKQQYLAACVSEKKDSIELYNLSHKGEKTETYAVPLSNQKKMIALASGYFLILAYF